jgi:HSP20 family protein
MELDEAIGQVSQLYRSVTGREMPASDAPYAPIPAEKDPVQHVQEQIDKLVILLNGPMARANAAAPWAPPIAIYESASEVLVAVDVPGTNRDRIDVQLEAGLLVVTGQRAPSPVNGQLPVNGHSLRHAEARFGTFRRVVPLPPGLRTADMTARLDRGVLEVRIPRDGANGVRQVSVA